MINKEREAELLLCWYHEQNDSWRDDCEESARWREELTEEERQLAAGWDRETPEDLMERLFG